MATKGFYRHLSGRPALGTAAATNITDYATAAQGTKADTALQPGDIDGLGGSGSSLETISQAEAEAGTSTTPRNFTAQRVFQSAAAWWNGSAFKTKLDGIATGATLNATNAQLRDRATHTGTQAASSITGLATVATTGVYTDLSDTPTLGTAAATNITAYATAAQGALADSAIQQADIDALNLGGAGLDTISQAEAEAGTSTTPRNFTAQRVFQAIAAWWLGSADKTKIDGIATGATANATNAQLRDRTTHTGTQAAGTITGLATVATSGAYNDLSGRPTLGTAAATASSDYATAAQGALAATAIQPANAALSNAREWTANTVTQAEAEAGSLTTRLAYTPQRVFQAVAAWWAASAAKTKLDGIATGATANASDAQLRDRATHTGTQAASSITGLATVATTGAYNDLTGKPALGTAASTASSDYATAAQGALAATSIQSGNAALTNSREWTADTINQADAEAGTATTRQAFTAQRVFQAIAAWWSTSSAATKLAGIANGATVNATDAQLRDRSTHTGVQSAGTITGLSTVATTGAYNDLSGRPTLGTAASTAAADYATAAQGALAATAIQPANLVSTSTAGLQLATGYSALTYAATTNLDMAALDGQTRTITLTGNITFTTSNRANGRVVTLRLLPGGSSRTLAFPVEWPFVCVKPATLAANKTAILTINSFGTGDADCVAAYAVQP